MSDVGLVRRRIMIIFQTPVSVVICFGFFSNLFYPKASTEYITISDDKINLGMGHHHVEYVAGLDGCHVFQTLIKHLNTTLLIY